MFPQRNAADPIGTLHSCHPPRRLPQTADDPGYTGPIASSADARAFLLQRGDGPVIGSRFGATRAACAEVALALHTILVRDDPASDTFSALDRTMASILRDDEPDDAFVLFEDGPAAGIDLAELGLRPIDFGIAA